MNTKPSRPVDSVLDLIGGTPIVRLGNLPEPGWANLFAKLEFMSPGFSVKDRLGIGLIRHAEREGLIGKGSTIVEPTAGNTGIGLALVGARLGYRIILVVPEGYSVEKQKLMTALGGKVVNTPADDGMKAAIEKAYEIASGIEGAYVPQQFANPANAQIHYETTAVEIWEQMEGRVDAFVAGSGTGGTFTGVARYLREQNPKILTVLVEPQGSVLGGGEPGPHDVEGIGASFIPESADLSLADSIVMVADAPAFRMVKRLALEEGVLGASSAGASVHAALDVARDLGEGKNVVTIIPDSSERYLSKDIYDWKEAEED